MSNKLKELYAKLNKLREEAAGIFEAGGDDYDLSAEQVERVRALNAEMTDLGKEIDAQKDLEQIHAGVDDMGRIDNHPGHPTAGRDDRAKAEPAKTLGELFVESEALTGWHRGMRQGPTAELDDVDLLATLFETSAGWAPADVRGPQVVDYALRPVTLLDLFPRGATSAASVLYMEETTATNAAAETAEAAAKPESTLALTERTEPVRKIATLLPITDEQLEDVPQARSYVDNRLGFFVQQRLEAQVIAGDGTAPNISGILDRSGLQTQAKGADPVPDAVYKAMTKIRVNAYSEPNAAVFHPNDWQDVRLLRTADGIYIWGSPADAGPERIWGLTVAQSTAITENTGLVGDFRQTQLIIRKGVTVDVGYINDDFGKNRQTVRAEMRAALAVYRPAAFCTVTSI